MDITLIRPCTIPPFDNNVHDLPVTSTPETHVVPAQVAPMFISSP